jgi:predicted nucleic acid-binding protein
VLVAYYVPEALSEKVDAFLTRASAPALSPLSELEFASALSRRLRMGEIDRRSARAFLAEFDKHLASGAFQRLPFGDDDYALARRWITKFRTTLRTLDALHLAIAARAGLRVITADARLATAARGLRRPVRLLKAA